MKKKAKYRNYIKRRNEKEMEMIKKMAIRN